MPNLVAISQATAKINRGAESPPGIDCFKSPRSDRVKDLLRTCCSQKSWNFVFLKLENCGMVARSIIP